MVNRIFLQMPFPKCFAAGFHLAARCGRWFFPNLSQAERCLPILKDKFTTLLQEKSYYARTFRALDEEIEKQARDAKKEYKIYKQGNGEFFRNACF